MEIKHRYTDAVLFTHEGETIKEVIEAAVKVQAYLKGAYLKGANLEGANLEGAYLKGAYLEGANLKWAYLEGAYLEGANLEWAYLKGANLEGANLEGAYLKWAYLKGAYLEGAYLKGANLEGANLEGAYLKGAYLEGANLEGANLTPFKDDLFSVLLRAIPEISMFKQSIVEGRIDGSTYDGDCCCLNGTLYKSKSEVIRKNVFAVRDASRPIERFFIAIKKGDTPETNPVSKLVLEWVEEFEGYIQTT